MVTITPWSAEAFGSRMPTLATNLTATAWPTTNKSIFYPFFTEEPVTFATLFLYTGATVTNNVDVGIFDITGKKIISTGTKAASASTLNLWTVASTTIGVGTFYFGVACAGTATTMFGYAGTNQFLRYHGCLEMASNFVLGDATFAQTSATFIPLVGLSTRAAI